VIVALAAWLYIVQALLGLGSLFSGPFGMGGGAATFATLLVSCTFGAMGYGLLKREAWGRWLALGVSLLGWTFGSLMLLGMLAALVVAGKGGVLSLMFAGTAFAIVLVLLVFVVLIMLVSVVISFKLFFYLCSQDGCEEFGVPYGSAGTVVASVAAWIAIMIGQAIMSSGGLLPLLASQALARNDRSEIDPHQVQLEAERREYQGRHEEQQRHAEQEARLRAIREAEDQQQAIDAARNVEPLQTPAGYQPPMADEARAPTITEARDEEEKPSANQILKCRDSAGAVTFTQGYCPPGTQRVDMPKGE
jgi:hypothetical protein